MTSFGEEWRDSARDHRITTHFKPIHTLHQSLVHPKDKQPKGRVSGVVYGVQCSEDLACKEQYIGETSQPLLQSRMSQHGRASSSSNESAVHASGHSFDIQVVHVLDCDSCWFERGMKEVIWVWHEQLSLNLSWGVRVKLSHGWDRIIQDIPRRMTSSPVSIPTDRKSSQGPSQPSWRSQVAIAMLVAPNQVYVWLTRFEHFYTFVRQKYVIIGTFYDEKK